jgi:ketosteroid isomerase-like protein
MNLLLVVLLLFSSIDVYSQTKKQSLKIERVQNELQRIEREIGDANVRRDKAYFERIEADEFIFTDSGGGLTNKTEDVSSFDKPTGETKLISYTPDEMKVAIYGDTAVVTGRVTSVSRGPKGEATIRSRFTDVFVKRNGRWQIVAGHSSRLRP